MNFSEITKKDDRTDTGEGVGILSGKGGQLSDGGVFFENDLSFVVGENFQRVTLTDSHGAADLLGDDHTAKVVDAADNSGCFHIYKSP